MRNLLTPLAQRGHVDSNHAEAVVEILPELALRHALFEVGIGGGQDPHVHALRPRLADRHDFALFEKAEQLGLDVERQVADFIQEQRAARRRIESGPAGR